MSNRQRLQGVGYPRGHGDDVRFYFALASALYRGDEDAFCATLEAQTWDLLRAPPSPPDGVPSDERIARVSAVRRVDEAASAVEQVSPSVPTSMALGFSGFPVAIAAAAAGVIGFLHASISPGSSIPTPDALDAGMRERSRSEGKPWVAIVSGSSEVIARYLDGLQSAKAIFVCANVEVLGALGVPVIDTEVFAASEIGYERTPSEQVIQDLEHAGYRAWRFTLGDRAGSDDLAVLDAVARVGRWTSERPQALVLSDAESAMSFMRAKTRAYDLVAYCTDPALLKRLGLSALDAEAGTVEDDHPVDVGRTTPMTVAAHTVENPIAAVVRYITEHPGTIKNYDLIAGTIDEVTPQIIRATRRPWMNSRISASQGTWFVERASSAPWALVPRNARLQDADAAQLGDLYDAATELWEHFSKDAPKGVGVAKISKVLYLMRPALFPILDSRLLSLYNTVARAVARDVGARRPDIAHFKRMTWEAVRRDLMSNEAALQELRQSLCQLDIVLASEVSSKVSDLRILDMLAWAAAGEPSTDDERAE